LSSVKSCPSRSTSRIGETVAGSTAPDFRSAANPLTEPPSWNVPLMLFWLNRMEFGSIIAGRPSERAPAMSVPCIPAEAKPAAVRAAARCSSGLIAATSRTKFRRFSHACFSHVQHGASPNGSLNPIGLFPAYAYKFTPPASPMGSCVRKVPWRSDGNHIFSTDDPLAVRNRRATSKVPHGTTEGGHGQRSPMLSLQLPWADGAPLNKVKGRAQQGTTALRESVR